MSALAPNTTATTPPRLHPGDRVRIVAELVGWVPRKLTGTFATVTKATAGGITIHTDVICGAFRTRYIPRSYAAECLERLDG